MSCTVLISDFGGWQSVPSQASLICATTAEQVALQTYSLAHEGFGKILE